ncbi:MAG: DegT/DnrJ/EryC1/StrS family aminotransferase [Candidatus Thiosymbion ectosymbiont of Robbea hypermnestra]|nr:DegT/DnrJ/EryC1/StrS family aminotransferase [Candidatus Thiosymbion ectosymbiont of Robbea hypermnestra]
MNNRTTEDCAHSLGTKWYDRKSGQHRHIGHHGKSACFSTQSYKLLNSGEGGFLATDDREVAAYCILAAGSYEKLYKKHISVPSDVMLFETLKPNIPNFSIRMSNLTAAVLRPQIPLIDEKIARYNKNYNQLANLLANLDCIEIPQSLCQVVRVANSFQFNLVGMSILQIKDFISNVTERGIKIQIFGHGDNARYFQNWQYSFKKMPELRQTDDIISSACDIRLPLSFDTDDINLIGYIIRDTLYKMLRKENRVDYKEGLTDNFIDIEEVISKYDGWTSDYDLEHQENGWKILLNHTAYTITDYLPNDAEILDVGCGTGLLGTELYAYGFNHIHGIDISEKSLDVARGLDIYKKVYRAELGKYLDFADNSFDALVSCGVFTRKQVPVNTFEELFRILKTGGIFAVVLRVEDEGYYDIRIQDYCAGKVLTEILRKRLCVLQSCSHDLLILKKSA